MPVAVIVPPVVPTPPATKVTTPAAPTSVPHAQPPTAPDHFKTSPGEQSSAKSILLPVAASVINRRFTPPPVLLIMAVVMRSLRMVAATEPEPLAVTSPLNAVIPESVSAAASQAEPLYFNTWPGVGAVVERFTPRIAAALTNVRREPSTAGICAEPFNCRTWLLPVPTSILNVMPPAEPPPRSGDVVATSVISPPALLSAEASQAEPLYFNTWPGVGAVVDRFTPRIAAALTNVRREPSTAGICAEPFNCRT